MEWVEQKPVEESGESVRVEVEGVGQSSILSGLPFEPLGAERAGFLPHPALSRWERGSGARRAFAKLSKGFNPAKKIVAVNSV